MAGLAPVSQTALGVARIRAAESTRPDRLFDDPYAQAFVDAMPGVYADDVRSSGRGREVGARIAVHVVMRTRWYDDRLVAAARDGVRQVVVLAAGLDTRAFRLGCPAGTRWFEVDLPELLAFKDRVLAAAGAVAGCVRLPVAADLTGDWAAAMARHGFDPEQPTAWLVEGLLVYLSPEEAAALLETVGGLSAPGSRLFCEQGRSAQQLAAQAAEAGVSRAASLWQGGLADVPGWLRAHGWAVTTVGLDEVAAGYGRPIGTGTSTGFVLATR